MSSYAQKSQIGGLRETDLNGSEISRKMQTVFSPAGKILL